MLKNVKLAKKNALKRVEHMKQQIEIKDKEHQRKVEKMKQQIEEETTKYQDVVEEEKKRVQELSVEVQWQKQIIQGFEVRFSNLAGLANVGIKGIPERLRMAEQMIIPFDTPVEIRDFVGYCKDLMEE